MQCCDADPGPRLKKASGVPGLQRTAYALRRARDKREYMFILGLTGSVGMGKSTTAKFFAEEGVPVHDADAVVHRLYEGEATPLIEAAFPGTTSAGKVDRDKLGKRVFGDGEAIKTLEGIVHPLVAVARDKFLAEAEKSGAKVAVLDIPLLYETGGDKRCHAVVVVSAPAEVQRARVFERPGMSEAKFAVMLARQMPDAEKRRRADFIVNTSQGYEAAHEQVREILRRVATMANRKH
jgi:dephospho-CoA kinase